MDTLIYAAPLQGFTETAWRNAHQQVFGGTDAYTTPFIRLERGAIRNKDKREVAPSLNQVHRLVPQLIASEATEFQTLTGFLYDLGYREIELNMGCPFPLMANHGKGSGLLPFPERIDTLLHCMEEWPDTSFSVKMRLGWMEANEWEKVLPSLNRSCVKRITLHPRIGKQQYKGEVDKQQWQAFYDACEKPLVYNGDVTRAEQAAGILRQFPRLHGLMIGRGLLARPSLAEEIRTGVAVPQEELYPKVARMHQLMLERYSQQLEGGEGQLLQKLKTMWEYLLPELDKKHRKAILKANKLATYLKNVEEALSVSYL